MTTLQRYLEAPVKQDLAEKMVFIGGPRQVGKTTFAQSFIAGFRDGHPACLNWDATGDKKKIREALWPTSEKLIVLDEIHKYKRWRQMIKGHYDKLKNTHRFLITGSARLDYYRKSGDSLLGRYFYYRLHPLSFPELNYKDLEGLLKFGGFPEPYLKQSETSLRRWHKLRGERIIYSDVRDLERVKEISLIQLFAEALPDRVGSPLSRKSLAHDFDIDFKTVERWINILENVYYCFRIPPYGSAKIRAVKKEQKLYLWDWSEIENEGVRWENFVASHLLKYCHYLEDKEGRKMELRFLRDADKREIDFVVMQNKKPLFAVECKKGEKQTSPHIHYFKERTNIPRFYQVHQGQENRNISDVIAIRSFEHFCRETGLV
ncbi:MAG: ATP-binding protein [Deltaproteobacteria bacterium]|nr:ATP-binding protein [Deltaproteobacteria bacterium]